MIRHYYTLYKVAEELRSLRGYFLTECFTQEKNVVMFVFETREEVVTVECSIDPRTGTLFRRPDFSRARKNTLDLFPALLNRTLRDVRIADNERIVTFDIGGTNLHCIFFGGGKGNLIAERDGVIVDAFKQPKELAGTQYEVSQQHLLQLDEQPPETDLQQALLHSPLLLTKYYALEFCRRRSLNPRALLSSLTSQQIREVERAATVFRSECLASSTFYLLRDRDDNPLMSLLPLEGYTTDKTFTSVSDAIRARISTGRRESSFRQEHDSVVRDLRKQLHKTERALQALDRDAVHASRESERRLYAELLMAQPNPQRKGMENITVQSWDGEEVTIPLAPALSLLDNAQKFFEKARTAKESTGIRERRKQQYIERFTVLQQALDELATIEDSKLLANFLSRHSQFFSVMSDHSEQKERKYREFTLDNGYTLYVGKSAANNDELTMRFAKPNDYWFHARGVSGSHVVLRGPDTGKPPKQVLEQAASIAAHYSKARNAGYTPVAYTQKKYVRKPKGAAVGAVVIEREEVIMVKPGLPVQENE